MSVKAKMQISDENFCLSVRETGGIQLDIDSDSYLIESWYSYPGERIGENHLSEEKKRSSEQDWNPHLTKRANETIEIEAQGKYYSLNRKIRLRNNRIEIKDTLTNRTATRLGIIVKNRITSQLPFKEHFLAGAPQNQVSRVPENPTLFFSGKHSHLGIVVEDNIFRLQLEASFEPNGAVFGINHFALSSGESYALDWAIYPFGIDNDYFSFINRIRNDWKTNFTIEGPWDFLDSNSPLLDEPDRLKAYLKRKKLKIVTLRPWLDYFDGADITRPQYKETIQRAIKIFKKADSSIKCIGAVENNIVSFDRAKIEKNELFNDLCKGSGEYPIATSAEQTRILKKILPWKDSFLTTPDGKIMIEDCRPTSFIHPLVYSEVGNYQADYLMGQVKFLIDDVGMDGVYIDDFNLAFGQNMEYHYGKWDSYTVDIDLKTGNIKKMYTDASLVGAKVREKLCKYVLSKGKIFVGNTNAAVKETQALPVFRFMEAEYAFDPLTFKDGEEPPSCLRICEGQLASPVALGYRVSRLEEEGLGISEGQLESPPALSYRTSRLKKEGRPNYAQVIMKSVITYLRHGLLYYHYDTDIPESGEGSGEYGPINHMFPFTPVELHKGWVLGKERIITCVSIDTFWEQNIEPVVRLFDLSGIEKDSRGRCQITEEEGEWHISLRLEDWKEIAVVETEGTGGA